MVGIRIITEAAGDITTIPQALVNTVIGMGVTFTILIMISFVISLFKFLPKLFERKKNNVVRPAQGQPPLKNLSMTKGDNEEADKGSENIEIEAESEEDFNEIVAVIMAAIEASMISEGMEVPQDGLVIRSIRKRSR